MDKLKLWGRICLSSFKVVYNKIVSLIVMVLMALMLVVITPFIILILLLSALMTNESIGGIDV